MATAVANEAEMIGTTVCTFTSSQNIPVLNADNSNYDDDDDDDDEDEGEDDAGSLVDFIVDDDENCDKKEATQEENECRDMDGINTSNIILGKRRRNQTKFYEQEVFNTDEYRKMILCDIPKEEMHAVVESGDEESGDEESDEDISYSGEADSDNESDEEDSYNDTGSDEEDSYNGQNDSDGEEKEEKV